MCCMSLCGVLTCMDLPESRRCGVFFSDWSSHCCTAPEPVPIASGWDPSRLSVAFNHPDGQHRQPPSAPPLKSCRCPCWPRGWDSEGGKGWSPAMASQISIWRTKKDMNASAHAQQMSHPGGISISPEQTDSISLKDHQINWHSEMQRSNCLTGTRSTLISSELQH